MVGLPLALGRVRECVDATGAGAQGVVGFGGRMVGMIGEAI